MKKLVSLLFVLAAGIFVVIELSSTWQEANTKPVSQSYAARDFSLPMLNGQNLTLSEQQGKVVILNFWASWCEPCKTEAPELQNFYEQYRDDVEIVAVNITKKDQPKAAAQFVEDYRLTFPVVLDEVGDVTTMFGAFTIPTTVILDGEGNIVQEIRGPLDNEWLEENIVPLI